MNTQSSVIICPLCGTENSSSEMDCILCKTNFKYAFENPEEIQAIKQRKLIEAIRQHKINEASRITNQGRTPTSVGQETHVDETMPSKPPWYDEGEDIVVKKTVAHDVMGQPIEAYYYEPFTGYGHIRFLENAISFGFPNRSAAHDPRTVYPADGYRNPIDYGFDLIIHLFMQKISQTKNIKWSTQIQYRDIQDLSLCGRSVEISSRGKPRKLKIRVGRSDGERLYRELFLRYPVAIARWRATLQDIFGL